MSQRLFSVSCSRTPNVAKGATLAELDCASSPVCQRHSIADWEKHAVDAIIIGN
jgi:hypothetical protein